MALIICVGCVDAVRVSVARASDQEEKPSHAQRMSFRDHRLILPTMVLVASDTAEGTTPIILSSAEFAKPDGEGWGSSRPEALTRAVSGCSRKLGVR